MAAHSIGAKDIHALSGRDYARDGKTRGSVPALRRLLTALGARFARWRTYRSTVAELAALTDRQLADIGVTRGEILAVARSVVRQPIRW